MIGVNIQKVARVQTLRSLQTIQPGGRKQRALYIENSDALRPHSLYRCIGKISDHAYKARAEIGQPVCA